MTRYIERLNRVEAIQNNGEYIEKILPFLNEHGIQFEYRNRFTEGKNISIGVGDKLLTLNIGDYIVAGSAGVATMSPEKFKRGFEEDIDLQKHITDLEAKLSTAMTEIDKLKATIKLERAMTDNKITDAVIKCALNGK